MAVLLLLFHSCNFWSTAEQGYFGDYTTFLSFFIAQKLNGKLIIAPTRKQDSGVYICVASNIVGVRESGAARLTVLGECWKTIYSQLLASLFIILSDLSLQPYQRNSTLWIIVHVQRHLNYCTYHISTGLWRRGFCFLCTKNWGG